MMNMSSENNIFGYLTQNLKIQKMVHFVFALAITYLEKGLFFCLENFDP